MDKPTQTPETIYLIPDAEHGHVWCDDPAPGLGMDPEDAIEYRRADVADTALAAAEARIVYLEQLASERLEQMTADAERIAEMKKVLGPFAREAETFGHRAIFPDDLHPVCDDEPHPSFRAKFTVGDLRRAAALLKEKE